MNLNRLRRLNEELDALLNDENEEAVEYQKFSRVSDGFRPASAEDYTRFFNFIYHNEWKDISFSKNDIELLVKSRAENYNYTLYLFYIKSDKSYGLAGEDNDFGDGFLEYGEKTLQNLLRKIDSWWNRDGDFQGTEFLTEYPDFKFLK